MLQLIGGAKPVGTAMRDLLQDDRARDLPALLVAPRIPTAFDPRLRLGKEDFLWKVLREPLGAGF